MQRNRNTNEYQKVKAPFHNAVMEEEQFEEDDEIHYLEDKGSASFLTLAAYEESLFNDQISQGWDDGVVLQADDQHKYNLRSKKNTANQAPVQKVVVPAKQQASKQQIPAADPIILKAPAHEVRVFDKISSPFSFEAEIQKLKIPIPLIELIKNEASKELFSKPSNLKLPKPLLIMSICKMKN